MSRIESGLDLKPIARTGVAIGSRLPTLRYFFDQSKVWRALAKIAVNLLHHYCRRTRVNHETFSIVIAEILGTRSFDSSRLDRGGFVCAGDVANIASDSKSHTIRISWESGRWHAAMAFFGGQIGAAVNFRGPNEETWHRLDVRAPLNSSDWTVATSPLIIPARFNIELSDLKKMILNCELIEM